MKYASGSPCPFNPQPPALSLLNSYILFMPSLTSMIIIVLRVEDKKQRVTSIRLRNFSNNRRWVK
jgi:hypothetical protein